MINEISYKPCQWLAWRLWWHELAFVTQEITCRLIKPAAAENYVISRPNPQSRFMICKLPILSLTPTTLVIYRRWNKPMDE